MVAAKYGVLMPSSSSEMVDPKYGVMFTCERKGKKIACEDGVTCVEEEKETEQTMLECMTSVPDWLEGFPVGAEAEIGKDFTIA
jgi:hypothetical protein